MLEHHREGAHAAPLLDQHNREILGHLDYTLAEIRRFRATVQFWLDETAHIAAQERTVVSMRERR